MTKTSEGLKYRGIRESLDKLRSDPDPDVSLATIPVSLFDDGPDMVMSWLLILILKELRKK